MTLNTQLSSTVVNSQASAIATLCNNATISIYDGVQPATADTAVTTQTLGATLTMANVAFSAPINGLLTANTITSGIAVAAITPTWARITSASGVKIMDVSVGVSGANITMTGFVIGDTVSITSFTHSVLASSTGI